MIQNLSSQWILVAFTLQLNDALSLQPFLNKQLNQLIGTKLPGTIVRAQCEAYNYTVKETGEVISLAHTYQYSPVEAQQARVMHTSPY